MDKVMSIKCNYDLSFSNRFNEIESWSGNIVIDGDGWFVGTVKEKYSSSKRDRLICGVILPNKGIQIFKFSSSEVSCPLIYLGVNNNGEYSGEFEISDTNSSQKCGVFKTSINNLDLDMEQMPSLASDIRFCFSFLLNELSDNDIKEAYNNAYILRYKLKQALAKKLESKDNRDLNLINYNIFKPKDNLDKIRCMRYFFDNDSDEFYD